MALRKTGLLLAGCAAAFAARSYWRARSRIDFPGKTVVITGGARGLGLELARIWCREGARVAICSRTARDVDAAVADLQRISRDAFGTVCDVTCPDEVDTFLSAVRQRFGRVDILVNNAGAIQVGPAEHMTLEDFQSSIQTHLWGPFHMIQAVLPEMQHRGSGHIVNIASIGGKISVPHLLPYCVGKFALVGLSNGLRHELGRYGIRVTTVCPGLMRTGSPRNASFKGSHRAEYAWFSIGASLPGLTIGSQRAAHQIVEACRFGKAEVTLSLPAKLAVRLLALFPEITALALEAIARTLPGPTPSGALQKKGAESTSAWSPSFLTVLNERAALRNLETH
jgi:NAD(P)-dependent dehydrogenase (short-subunit alcohol dehydrogenase family)